MSSALSSACDFKSHFSNSVDPDQTAPLGAVWSGSTLFACMQKKVWKVSRIFSRRHKQTFSDAGFLGVLRAKTWTSLLYYLLLCLKIAGWMTNSVDPDQRGPHNLLRSVCPNILGYYWISSKKLSYLATANWSQELLCVINPLIPQFLVDCSNSESTWCK